VRFFHFADMKRDLSGSIRKVADFLGIAPSADQWTKIDEYASFDWTGTTAPPFTVAGSSVTCPTRIERERVLKHWLESVSTGFQFRSMWSGTRNRRSLTAASNSCPCGCRECNPTLP
jgi:hypothetical protein